MNIAQLSDEELHRHLARIKKDFEDSVANGDYYDATNIVYLEFVELRDEVNRRIRQKAAGKEDRSD